VLGLVLTLSLLPLTAVAGTSATSAAPVEVQPAAAAGRHAELSLQLVSRTFNVSTNNWTVVVDATLDSNYLCFPLLFDCIVGELTDPPNANLTDLQCLSPLWSHLIVFRNHCLKQVGHAGQDAKFRLTYLTDPGVTTGSMTVSAEFGRGVLPVTFQQLATASLNVDLNTSLDLAKTCPDTVASSAAVECTITVSYPFSSGPAIPATIVDEPDGALIVGGTLTQASGTPSWTCASLTCSATVNAGESATFTYAGAAAATSAGGDGYNRVRFTSGGTASVTDEITVVGTGDAYLGITKTSAQQDVKAGEPVTYTITLTNSGGLGGSNVAAADVEVADTAPALVSGMALSFTSGVGTWACNGLVCTTASMPVGSATFTASGTLSAEAVGGTIVLNEVGVTWFNDVFGPAYSEVAGAAVTVQQTTTTTTTVAPTTTAVAPTTTAVTPTTTAVTTGSRSGGTELTFAG
jgi:uncharacterized repeat protein (TIGR01451 family)